VTEAVQRPGRMPWYLRRHRAAFFPRTSAAVVRGFLGVKATRETRCVCPKHPIQTDSTPSNNRPMPPRADNPCAIAGQPTLGLQDNTHPHSLLPWISWDPTRPFSFLCFIDTPGSAGTSGVVRFCSPFGIILAFCALGRWTDRFTTIEGPVIKSEHERGVGTVVTAVRGILRSRPGMPHERRFTSS